MNNYGVLAKINFKLVNLTGKCAMSNSTGIFIGDPTMK